MSRQVLSAEDIATVTPKNRLICDPFPRRVVSRDQANQGAAVLLTSVGKARALGIASDRWIFLHGGSFLLERPVIERPDLSQSPAARAAMRLALAMASVELDQVDVLDLYSCFPIAVFNICDAFGLAADDPRGLTVTGGLPYFGGAGNNYSMHAIAETVRRLRERPEALGLVGANSGYMSKYAVGIYSAKPAPFQPFDNAADQAELDGAPRATSTDAFSGAGTIETYTIDYAEPQPRAVVVGRTREGVRFVAGSTEPAIVEQMIDNDPLGATVTTMADDSGRNLVVGLGWEDVHERADQRRAAD
jgi:acetyl-CoA C-acetyltransferase